MNSGYGVAQMQRHFSEEKVQSLIHPQTEECFSVIAFCSAHVSSLKTHIKGYFQSHSFYSGSA